MQACLIPTSNKLSYLHYVQTVEYQTDLSIFINFLPKGDKKYFLQNNRSTYSIWGINDGARDRNKHIWDRLNNGDMCLFYRNKEFISKGRVFYKASCEDLSKELWGRSSKGAWKNLIFLDLVESISIPLSKINKTLGYKQDYILRSFSILDSKKSAKIFKEISNSEDPISRRDFYQTKLTSIKIPTDKTGITKSRVEQDVFADFLFGNSIKSKCVICNETLPNNFLVAGHIKKRSLASENERKDLNIVMPICKFGCDDLFEKGYIYVNEEGILKSSGRKPTTKFVTSFIKKHEGKRIRFFNEKNRQYFNDHMQHFLTSSIKK